MEQLWAPWRIQYLRQLEQGDAEDGCFLCAAAACDPASDEAAQRLVLCRSKQGVLLLNRYPYSNGHLLVACLDHVGKLSAMSAAKRSGLMELTMLAQRLLEVAMNPQGFNVGINLGRCAGAGFPGHLHMHVVPRWSGDTNFMQVFGQVRVIPQALEESYRLLAATMRQLDRPQASSGDQGASGR